METSHTCDVLVIGDEVESLLTAISAARAGARVLVARTSEGRLGGLSVRGGLSYMDITVEHVYGLFQEFLTRAEVIQVGLDPAKAHTALATMLQEAGVTVLSGVVAEVEPDDEGFPALVRLGNSDVVEPKAVIDATPDADATRQLGVPYIMGLGGILGEDQDFLGVSPVFRIEGVPVEDMRAFEARLRERADIREVLDKALPYHAKELREEYVTRPTFAPTDKDYLDILNPVIGIYFHLWRHGGVDGYAHAPIAIDGGNVSRLPDGSLGLNGLVARPDLMGWDFDDLLAMSHGGPIPDALTEEMRAFEKFLREEGGLSDAKVVPPEALYVRQTLNLLARDNMTAAKMVAGGASPEKAVGTFSYWLDLRGTQLWEKYPGQHLPKPVFNLSLDVCLPMVPKLENIAFVSRAAGYSPIGQGAGRIIQHNSLLGEALGIAAAMACRSGRTLNDIATAGIAEIQNTLRERHGSFHAGGFATMGAEEIAENALLREDSAIVERLKRASLELTV